MTPVQAAIEAARTRLRPILMTSVAFIFGVIPLAFGSGPGAELRQALGVAVFYGHDRRDRCSGCVFTPVFYMLCRKLARLIVKVPRMRITGGETDSNPGVPACGKGRGRTARRPCRPARLVLLVAVVAWNSTSASLGVGRRDLPSTRRRQAEQRQHCRAAPARLFGVTRAGGRGDGRARHRQRHLCSAWFW